MVQNVNQSTGLVYCVVGIVWITLTSPSQKSTHLNLLKKGDLWANM